MVGASEERSRTVTAASLKFATKSVFSSVESAIPLRLLSVLELETAPLLLSFLATTVYGHVVEYVVLRALDEASEMVAAAETPASEIPNELIQTNDTATSIMMLNDSFSQQYESVWQQIVMNEPSFYLYHADNDTSSSWWDIVVQCVEYNVNDLGS